MPSLRLTATLLACIALPATAQENVMVMRAEALAPGLTVISGFTNGNILVLTGADGTLLVDAQSARRAPLADSVLATLGAPPVRWIVNTHYHGDHVEGNPLWHARGAGIIGQEQLAVQMAKDTLITSWGEWHRTPADPASFPTRTFRDTLSITFDGQPIRLVHIPSAHTDGDAIVWLPDANLMHIGDLFEHDAPPFIDWWAGGRIEGMLAGVDWGLAQSDGVTRIVPGHGPVGTRAQLLEYRQMLLGVSAAVASRHSPGAHPRADPGGTARGALAADPGEPASCGSVRGPALPWADGVRIRRRRATPRPEHARGPPPLAARLLDHGTERADHRGAMVGASRRDALWPRSHAPGQRGGGFRSGAHFREQVTRWSTPRTPRARRRPASWRRQPPTAV